jgi:uncharacterized protein (TIGR01777 family)
MNRKRCVLAGGSGFLGTALAEKLMQKGYEVIVLGRSPGKVVGGVRHLQWDGKVLGAWAEAIDGCEAVVNFTGKSVACRYTPQNRDEIVSSRVNSVKVIAAAIAGCKTPPKAWVQCGSLAIYGDAGERICDENAVPADGFSPETCLLWEQAFESVMIPATRKVLFRIGFVLGEDKGALHTLAKLAKFYLGGAAGNGRQYISWIDGQDMNQMFLWAIERPDIRGVFNATSPNPVTNAQFMFDLRGALNRPWSPPVPAWAVRIGAGLMGIEAELALTGRRCVPARFQNKGFEFKHPILREALDRLFTPEATPLCAAEAASRGHG